jgi:excisionase family DNA binding protein
MPRGTARTTPHTTPADGLDALLTPQVVADALGVPLQTLYTWRVKQAGPRGIKVGRHLRYRRSDVEAWLEAQADDRPAA